MQLLKKLEGRLIPLDKTDVDTDVIMPVQFLKHPERTGFSKFLFHNWMEEPTFVLNDPRFAGANVLVAGPNFGCGSSREHAPWGLQEYGFDAIIAPSFGDIFRNNCAKIGLLCAQAERTTCRDLMALAEAEPQQRIVIDLPQQTITAKGRSYSFEIDAYSKKMLLDGLDHIEQSLRYTSEIQNYELGRKRWLPSLRR